MTSPKLLFVLTCFLGEIAQITALDKSSVRRVSRETGETLTLQCFYEDAVSKHAHWFRQTLEGKLEPVSYVYRYMTTDHFHGEFQNNSRFSLDAQTGKNHLTISDLHVSDSATYYCLICDYCKIRILETVNVIVKSKGLIVPNFIHQSVSETIQPGDSVTLNCSVQTGSCDGEHRVYWFKNSEESQPGAIYSSGGRNDQCERKPDSQTHTCTYNLPLKNLDVSHAGTYRCAVVSCGHILFGDEIKLDFKGQGNYPDSVVYFLSGGWAFTTILLLIFACKMNKESSKCAPESQNTRASIMTTAEVYKPYSSITNRDDTWSECVYFSARP